MSETEEKEIRSAQTIRSSHWLGERNDFQVFHTHRDIDRIGLQTPYDIAKLLPAPKTAAPIHAM